ncbi:MAG TPA: SpaA isopeptide-forming pilin-related protein, partial [Gemmatales bacterium]|nr:SpaA isopeptide-forming pilin-related protein [Gemmatales bacterium]
ANNAATNKWVPGKLVSGRYEAELQLPPNQKGPVPLGVRVIGGNGEKMDQSREVVAMEPPPPETSVGKVRVTVVQYVTDDPQSEMPVVLRNEKNEVLSTAKTDKKGEVLFEKLKPGKYEVGSVKAFDRSAGVSKVEIKPDEEAKVTIRLKRVR